MARRRTVWTLISLAVLAVPVAVWLGQPPTGVNESGALPGTVLTDAQMRNVLGGRDIIIEPPE